MTSRERVLTALRHEEADRVPYDLASTQVTGISAVACANLRRHLGMPGGAPNICDDIQQICVPHNDLLDRLGVDTRGIFPLTSHNWNVRPRAEGDDLIYEDEWGLVHRRPKDAYWFSLHRSPMDEPTLTHDAIARHPCRRPRTLDSLQSSSSSVIV